MAKKNPEKVAKIKANQKEALSLFKDRVSKSSTEIQLVQSIREIDARLQQLRKENIKLGGYTATLGMKPKQKTLSQIVKKIMKPGKVIRIKDAVVKILSNGYQTKNTAWFTAIVGKEIRGLKGVHRVPNERGTYVIPLHKKHKKAVHKTATASVSVSHAA